MNDLERGYLMGTEVGQLGGQGATFGIDGSCKDGKIGSGCCKFQGQEVVKCAEKRKARVRTGRSWRELY
jgi:hypothetical protein